MGMVGKATLKLNYDSVGANTRVVYFSSIPPPPPKSSRIFSRPGIAKSIMVANRSKHHWLVQERRGLLR